MRRYYYPFGNPGFDRINVWTKVYLYVQATLAARARGRTRVWRQIARDHSRSAMEYLDEAITSLLTERPDWLLVFQ